MTIYENVLVKEFNQIAQKKAKNYRKIGLTLSNVAQNISKIEKRQIFQAFYFITTVAKFAVLPKFFSFFG